MNDEVKNLQLKIESLEKEIQSIKQEYSTFNKIFVEHQHTKSDYSSKIRNTNILLKDSAYFTNRAAFMGLVKDDGTTSLSVAALSTGSKISEYEALTSNEGNCPNTQLSLQDQAPSDVNFPDAGFLMANRNIYFYELYNEPLEVTSSQTTLSYYKFDFGNKNFANQGYILTLRIIDDTGTLKDYGYTITSNTKNSVTFTPQIGVNGKVVYIMIYQSVYLGSSLAIWRKLLVNEGVRFGLGTTGNGQNGLLYMNSSGNLIFRKPNNSEITIGGLNISYYIFSFYETETLKSTTVPSGTIPLGWYVPQNGLLNNPNLAWVSIYVSGTTLYCQLSQSPGASGSDKAIAILVRYYYP